MVLVEELALWFGLDITAKIEQAIVRLFLPLEHCFCTRLKGLIACPTSLTDDFSHLCSLCLEEFNLFIEGLILVYNSRLFRETLAPVLKRLRLVLGSYHLVRRGRPEIDVHLLVLVLIFLTGEELEQAGVRLCSTVSLTFHKLSSAARIRADLPRYELLDWRLRGRGAAQILWSHGALFEWTVQIVQRAH